MIYGVRNTLKKMSEPLNISYSAIKAKSIKAELITNPKADFC